MPLPADRPARLRALRRRTAAGGLGLLVAAWIAVAAAGAKPTSHATAVPAASRSWSSRADGGSSSSGGGSTDAPLVTRQS
jgi:hypothetical protein